MLNFIYPLNALVLIAVPLLLGWYLTKRYGLAWRLFIVGVVTFILAQIFRIPINAGLALAFRQGILPQFTQMQALADALVFGLTAAFTAELARYFVLRTSLKEARSWSTSLLYGTGYGGAEVMLVGIIAGFTFISLTMSRQNTDFLSTLSPDQLQQLQDRLTVYWSAPWYAIISETIKTLTIIGLQISYTLLVVQVFVQGRVLWLLLALAWHWLAEAVHLYSTLVFGPAVNAVLSLVLVLIGLVIIYLLHSPEPAPPVLVEEQ